VPNFVPDLPTGTVPDRFGCPLRGGVWVVGPGEELLAGTTPAGGSLAPASGTSLGDGPATTAELTTAAGWVSPFAPASAVATGVADVGSTALAGSVGLGPRDASSTPAAPSAAANTRPPTTSPIRLPLPAGCAIPALG